MEKEDTWHTQHHRGKFDNSNDINIEDNGDVKDNDDDDDFRDNNNKKYCGRDDNVYLMKNDNMFAMRAFIKKICSVA